MFLALKREIIVAGSAIVPISGRSSRSAPSALPKLCRSLPRALPWAITFRAFGAEGQTRKNPLLTRHPVVRSIRRRR